MAKKAPTADEKRHWQRIVGLGCLVCGERATVHHVSASIHGGRITRSHQLVTPLCPRHHQIIYGPRESVEALSHRGFHAAYGIDLQAEAVKLWEESCESAVR